MRLTVSDRDLLRGAYGAGPAMAMRLIVAAGRAVGAPRLIDIEGAHVDSCLYHGQSSLDFVERLASSGATVRVPTTLNVGGLDLLRPDSFLGSAAEGNSRRVLMQRYQDLGCQPTFTCAPYQLPGRPRPGEHVAWAESNAIAFCNSVLGARTNRYGDLIDIAAALTGRVPYAGYHVPANRAGRALFTITDDALRRTDPDLLPALLGHHVGRRTRAWVPVVLGLPHELFSEDWGKAFGAAAASAGSVAMFHVVGATPEATTAESATGGQPAELMEGVTAADLGIARDELTSVAEGAPLDAVSIGTPHMSVAQLCAAAEQLSGQRVAVPTFVATGRHVAAQASEAVAVLEQAGVRIVRDTCTYISPVIGSVRVVMTNSAKWAYYAPTNLGYEVALGSTRECLASAVAGQIVKTDSYA